MVEAFLSGPFNNFVKQFKWPIIGFFFLFTIGMGIFASQIGPLSKQEEYLPEDHWFSVVQNAIIDDFPTGSSTDAITVYIIHGAKGLDKSDVSTWDSAYMGEIIWDEDFNIYPMENQQAMLDLCDLVDGFSQKEEVAEVDCWIKDF
jgi:hypothetical protein